MCSRGGRARIASMSRPGSAWPPGAVLHDSLIFPCDRKRSQLTARCVRMPQAQLLSRAFCEIRWRPSRRCLAMSQVKQSARVFVSIFFFAREGDGAEPDGEPTDGAARVRRCDCAAGRRHQLCASKRAAVVALLPAALPTVLCLQYTRPLAMRATSPMQTPAMPPSVSSTNLVAVAADPVGVPCV